MTKHRYLTALKISVCNSRDLGYECRVRELFDNEAGIFRAYVQRLSISVEGRDAKDNCFVWEFDQCSVIYVIHGNDEISAASKPLEQDRVFLPHGAKSGGEEDDWNVWDFLEAGIEMQLCSMLSMNPAGSWRVWTAIAVSSVGRYGAIGPLVSVVG